MRRFGTAVVACALLALGGFTAAVVAGQSPAALLQTTSTTTTTTPTTTSTSTSTSTSTTTSTTTTTTTTTTSKKVTICHRTHSKKKPYVKIRVSVNALTAHLRHGDILAGAGPCPTTVQQTDAKGHVVKNKSNNGKGKGKGRGR
jgi:cytoskeletal protein RodZ